MTMRLFLFFIGLMAVHISHAQTLPAPGARLNYTQIMFEYEKINGAGMYVVQVAEDTPRSSFDHSLIEQRDPATATMISGFEFGRSYKWRYAALPVRQAGLTDGQPPQWRGPWHFSIDSTTTMRLQLYALTVTKNDSAHNEGGLIANDGTYTITDRRGKVVWSLPRIDWQINAARATRVTDSTVDQVMKIDIRPLILDLRLNPYGTITYLSDSDIVECDLDGNKLWEKRQCPAPSEMGENGYNHVFMRMPGGHYMTLGNEGYRKMPVHLDSIFSRKKYPWRYTFDSIEYAGVDFGTVLEYDKAGNVVWTWNSEDYFDRDGSAPKWPNMEMKAHINALGVDREDRFVYVGFKDISRIVKVEKKTGRVVDSWGEQPTVGVGPMHHAAIHTQHDAAIQDDGSIMVFNNNDHPGQDSVPGVVIFSQAPDSNGEVIWRYDCDMDPSVRAAGRTRGNVELLKNGNILVCTGSVGTIFEVTRDKKIVWEAAYKWKDFPGYKFSHMLYRAHYISSLYPCYFTFTTDRDTLTKKSPKFKITIFNKGSEEDKYEIEVSEPGEKRGTNFLDVPVMPDQSIGLESSAMEHTKPHQIVVTVHSRTNPDLMRKRVIWYE